MYAVCHICRHLPTSEPAPENLMSRCCAGARAVQATAAALKAGASSLNAARAGIMASPRVYGGYLLMFPVQLSASWMGSVLADGQSAWSSTLAMLSPWESCWLADPSPLRRRLLRFPSSSHGSSRPAGGSRARCRQKARWRRLGLGGRRRSRQGRQQVMTLRTPSLAFHSSI